jgi:hypothetical protein
MTSTFGNVLLRFALSKGPDLLSLHFPAGTKKIQSECRDPPLTKNRKDYLQNTNTGHYRYTNPPGFVVLDARISIE